MPNASNKNSFSDTLFHTKYYDKLIPIAVENEDLRQKITDIQKQLTVLTDQQCAGGVVGKVARDLRAKFSFLSSKEYSKKRRQYITSIRSMYPLKQSGFKYDTPAKKFVWYRIQLARDHFLLSEQYERLKVTLERAQAKHKWREAAIRANPSLRNSLAKTSFKCVRPPKSNNGDYEKRLYEWRRSRCTYAGLIQISGTCWMNAMLNAMFLNPYVRLLLVKKWKRFSPQERREICGVDEYDEADRSAIKAKVKPPCKTYATCVRPPSNAEATSENYRRMLRNMIFAIFVNLVASPHGKRYVDEDGDFMGGISAFLKLDPKYVNASRNAVWSNANTQRLKDSLADWDNYVDKDKAGGSPRFVDLLFDVALPEEVNNGLVLIRDGESAEGKLRAVHSVYLEPRQLEDLDSRTYNLIFSHDVAPQSVIEENGKKYVLTSATLTWKVFLKDENRNNDTYYTTAHALAAFICDGEQYVYDSNVDYIRQYKQHPNTIKNTDKKSKIGGTFIKERWADGKFNALSKQSVKDIHGIFFDPIFREKMKKHAGSTIFNFFVVILFKSLIYTPHYTSD
jgi:hypothetical protein